MRRSILLGFLLVVASLVATLALPVPLWRTGRTPVSPLREVPVPTLIVHGTHDGQASFAVCGERTAFIRSFAPFCPVALHRHTPRPPSMRAAAVSRPDRP
jgi:hypothetical protein